MRNLGRRVAAQFAVDRRVLALAFARMADGIGNSFLVIVIPLYVASDVVGGPTFGLAESMIIGIILSIFGFLNSSFQPLTGRFSDRAGKRKLFVLIGLAGLATMNVAYLFAESYLSLLVIRGLQGISVAFIIPASVALVNELATTDDRGGNMGVYNTFRLIGFGAGPVVAGAVVNAGPYTLPIGGLSISGFDAAFYIAAITAIISFLLVTVLITDPESTRANASADLAIPVWDRPGPNLLNPIFTLGVASLFMATAIALFATIQPQVNTHLEQGATWFGLQFAAFIVAQILLQTPIGRACDRYGRRPFIVVGMGLLIPTTLAQGYVPTSETMFVARLLQGIAGAMVFAPSLALAGDLAGEGESGSKLSVLTMAFGFGIAIGPLSSGALVGYGFEVPFIFGTVLAVIGTVLVYTQIEETLEQTQPVPFVGSD
ncbi:major facilitator superfamily transport protein [Natrialba magadii ATCC 43099]|uniref:Major facilitator superfamily protein n=1 Tax=Natrialba magadii (strain ATCC 43099 / DSM 3394 / CCM 3739 / CIP 104546 / IAM 13178 / JCM 8861 / NBRC 102185 / NCIMB 2190 / MS3) TaxID=547559 RepID=D3SZQ0_NATMM|nr:MFS transporter [Natrialba magadii]ADD06310.1 major facilitator superfamily transport protein [Natrialba magadii ATCC 43099]ELY31253.1 major facilitator superfamily protein [Natrialba magadii ATCC 43099]